MEPEATDKRRSVANKLNAARCKASQETTGASTSDIKQRLREIREYSRDHIISLGKELENTIAKKYPGVRVLSAQDAAQAVNYISKAAGETRNVSVNKSSIITQEIKPGLVSQGFMVTSPYSSEYDVDEKKVCVYWELPHLLEKGIIPNFRVTQKLAGINHTGEVTLVKDYLAILGVNSVSVDDGTVFFVQHFHNILTDLKEANKVFLVVGLDKIAGNKEAAAFIAECMGIFGMESMLLGLKAKPGKETTRKEPALLSNKVKRELHVIILDNGRGKMIEGKFRDLLLCIGCAACSQRCPIRFSFDVDYNWTPRIYLNQYLRDTGKSLDQCLHCETCRVECPLDIDLPSLMWDAKQERKQAKKLKQRLLGTPETLAKLGSTVDPLSNRLMHLKLIRVPMEAVTGIDRRANLPTFHSQTFRKWFKENG